MKLLSNQSERETQDRDEESAKEMKDRKTRICIQVTLHACFGIGE